VAATKPGPWDGIAGPWAGATGRWRFCGPAIYGMPARQRFGLSRPLLYGRGQFRVPPPFPHRLGWGPFFPPILPPNRVGDRLEKPAKVFGKMLKKGLQSAPNLETERDRPPGRPLLGFGLFRPSGRVFHRRPPAGFFGKPRVSCVGLSAHAGWGALGLFRTFSTPARPSWPLPPPITASRVGPFRFSIGHFPPPTPRDITTQSPAPSEPGPGSATVPGPVYLARPRFFSFESFPPLYLCTRPCPGWEKAYGRGVPPLPRRVARSCGCPPFGRRPHRFRPFPFQNYKSVGGPLQRDKSCSPPSMGPPSGQA